MLSKARIRPCACGAGKPFRPSKQQVLVSGSFRNCVDELRFKAHLRPNLIMHGQQKWGPCGVTISGFTFAGRFRVVVVAHFQCELEVKANEALHINQDVLQDTHENTPTLVERLKPTTNEASHADLDDSSTRNPMRLPHAHRNICAYINVSLRNITCESVRNIRMRNERQRLSLKNAHASRLCSSERWSIKAFRGCLHATELPTQKGTCYKFKGSLDM